MTSEHPSRALSPLLLSAALLAACALPASLAGCGGPQERDTTPRADRLEPTVLYPMNEGATWAYDIDTGGGEPPTFGVYRVISVDGNQRQIEPFRQDPVTYELRPQGIYRVASSTWLLRAPIAEGASWPTTSGRTATVTSTSATAETISGNYEGCVEVVEEGGDSGLRIRTVYCPDVGPVIVEARQSLSISMNTAVTIGRLRSYDPGGEI